MAKASFEIICGTYEEFLLGYNFYPKCEELTQTFAAHDHTSSIRCVEFGGQYVASGGADDRIIIYDFKTRKEHCMLTHHDSTVNCIKFTNSNSHVMSGSADGVLSIVRIGNWQVEKLWDKAHKGAAILDIAAHSSGKLALTLGADCSLRTWNLVKGRQAYIINLYSKSKDPKSLEKLLWADDGVRFVIAGGKFTEIWSIETGGALQQIQHEEKVTSCIWYKENSLLVGYENGNIGQVDLEREEVTTIKAHKSRVKTLSKFDKWVVSGSSSGEIKVWKDLEEVCKHDTGCRITCMKIVPPLNVKIDETQRDECLQESSTVIEIADNAKGSKAKVEVVIEDEDVVEIVTNETVKPEAVVKVEQQPERKKKKKRFPLPIEEVTVKQEGLKGEKIKEENTGRSKVSNKKIKIKQEQVKIEYSNNKVKKEKHVEDDSNKEAVKNVKIKKEPVIKEESSKRSKSNKKAKKRKRTEANLNNQVNIKTEKDFETKRIKKEKIKEEKTVPIFKKEKDLDLLSSKEIKKEKEVNNKNVTQQNKKTNGVVIKKEVINKIKTENGTGIDSQVKVNQENRSKRFKNKRN